MRINEEYFYRNFAPFDANLLLSELNSIRFTLRTHRRAYIYSEDLLYDVARKCLASGNQYLFAHSHRVSVTDEDMAFLLSYIYCGYHPEHYSLRRAVGRFLHRHLLSGWHHVRPKLRLAKVTPSEHSYLGVAIRLAWYSILCSCLLLLHRIIFRSSHKTSIQ